MRSVWTEHEGMRCAGHEHADDWRGSASRARFRGKLPPNPDAQTCASGPREILSWEIGQKYFFDPTFGNALVTGERNVFTTSADFTGMAFLDSERRFAPIISRLRVETSPRTNTEWDVDYDVKTGQITSSLALVNYHYGPFTIGGGDAFLRVIDTAGGTNSTNCALRPPTPSELRVPPISGVVWLWSAQQARIERRHQLRI